MRIDFSIGRYEFSMAAEIGSYPIGSWSNQKFHADFNIYKDGETDG